ncbi:MAG: S9 family peptidase [Melioribacteraceae bacterium]|nr:S9 family peptidase [Melioribacteraceae bacterium]
MVSAQYLIPAGSEKPLSIRDYKWSPDGSKLLIFTNTQRVWRAHTRGDYWVLDLDDMNLFKLGFELPESSLMFTKFSPDNKMAAYVSNNNIYMESLADHKITQLTKDGSRTIINGTFDWVYEEELSLRDGFRWSPDSKKIALWQLDAEGVNDFYMINNADSLYSKLIPVQYPKAGTKNSACKVGVITIEDSDIKWMNVPGDARNNYIARMDWAAGSDEIYVQHLNRLQNKNEVMLCNASSGEVKTILTEIDEAWVDIDDDMLWFNDGKNFTWVSERDGWRHIYIVSRDGSDVELVTEGDFDVISVQYIDDKNGWIYFIASPEDRGQRYLYRVKLEANGNIERLTSMEFSGTSRYSISKNSAWAIHTASDFNSPSVTSLVSLPDHKVVRKLVENKKLKETVDALNITNAEFFTITTEDGVELDGMKIAPPNFDPNKKYPVLFYVYSEPGSQTVLDSWGFFNLYHQMIAQKGYIIMSIDSRGTPAPKGREWRKSIYRKIGILTSQDQASALKAIAEKWDYIDTARIGIWGWSGGGSMTLNMLFRYPELYKMGIAVAPVGDLRFYDTIYQERYMGLPSVNAKDYKNCSPVHFAENFKGDLLLIHGTGDDNVHYQNSEVVINELIKHNKYFTMFAYPNRSHSIYEGRNTTRHLFTMMSNYLYEHLKAGGIDK